MKNTIFNAKIATIFMSFLISSSVIAAECSPLLILVEGGFSSSGSSGESVQKLDAVLYERYGDKYDIPVMTIDSEYYWGHLLFIPQFIEDRRDTAAKHINASGYKPIVIVGHSLGGHVAYRIAQRVKTSILVTLDPVSFAGSRNHLKNPTTVKEWINIYDMHKPFWRPDWMDQNHATQNIPIGDSNIEHSDVTEMYFYAEDDIKESLSECPQGSDIKIKRGELCNVPGGDFDCSY